MSVATIFKRLFYLFCFTISLNQYLNVRILVAVLVLSLFVKSPKRALSISSFWDSWLYLLVLLGGLLYSVDLVIGMKTIETSFSFIALPIIFWRLKELEDFDVKKYFNLFCSGLLIACMTCLINAGINYGCNGDIQTFFFYNLTSPISLQPTYFAYYLSFGICFLLYSLYAKEETIIRNVMLVGTLFLFLMLMLTASRTAYIGMLFVLSFFILKYFFDETGKSNRGIAMFSAFLLVVMLLVNYFDLNGSLTAVAEGTDYWERSTLWEAALRANPNPLLGVGTGDYKTALNQYYQSQGMELFANESYNSHNQFIQIYFSNGILGLLALSILICRPLYLSFKVQNPLGILIIFPFIIYGVTEVFLGRFQGIVFFVFCHQLVVAEYQMVKPKLTLYNKENAISI